MKRRIINFLILWTFFIAQTSVFPMMEFLSAVPNLILLYTVAAGFMEGKSEGVITGFTGGLLIDLFYSDVLGVYALMYLLCGYFCGTFAQIYFDEDVKIPLLLTALCDIATNFVVYVIGFLLRGRVHFFAYLKSVILPEMLSTMLLMIILYKVIYSINHALSATEKKGRQSLWIRD